jgi:hypothetical protein
METNEQTVHLHIQAMSILGGIFIQSSNDQIQQALKLEASQLALIIQVGEFSQTCGNVITLQHYGTIVRNKRKEIHITMMVGHVQLHERIIAYRYAK